MQERSYEDSVGQRHSAGEYEAVSCKMKVNTCTVCEIGLFTEEEEEQKLRLWQFHVCHYSGVLYRLEVKYIITQSVIVSYKECYRTQCYRIYKHS